MVRLVSSVPTLEALLVMSDSNAVTLDALLVRSVSRTVIASPKFVDPLIIEVAVTLPKNLASIDRSASISMNGVTPLLDV